MTNDYNDYPADSFLRIRLPTSLLKRVDELVEQLQYHPTLAFRGKVTRSKLIRECLILGIPALEEMTNEVGIPELEEMNKEVAKRMTGVRAEKFWKKVEKTEGCWLWRGATYPGGYGIVKIYIGPNKDYSTGAHRVAWTLTHGPIPEGLHVLHRCDNPACVNPDHLWLGTHQENLADMVAKGRHLPGMERGREKRIGQKPTEQAKHKMSQAKRGEKHPRAHAIEIDGVIYPTLAAAAKAHGKTHTGISYWIRKGKAKSINMEGRCR